MYYVEKQRGEVKIGMIRAAYIPLIKNIVKPVNIVFVPKVMDEYNYSDFLKSVESMLKKENLIDENIE